MGHRNARAGLIVKVRHLVWYAFCFKCPEKYDQRLEQYVPAHFQFPSQQIAIDRLTRHFSIDHLEE